MIEFRKFLDSLETVRGVLEKNKSLYLHMGMLDMEREKWLKEIPFIKFPPHFQIQTSQPFGAVTRFRVRQKDSPKDQSVSVYLDCYDSLGVCGEPYWEIYPIWTGHGNDFDCERFLMNETDDLVDGIQRGLDGLNRYNNV